MIQCTEYISAIFPSPIGNLKIQILNNKLTRILFLRNDQIAPLPKDIACQSLYNELTAYFQNPQHCFQFPWEADGTTFQKRVWQTLCLIPAGATMTYGELAIQLNTSPRAIGNACRANPIPIIVPCHRIVAQHDVGGFFGETTGKMINIKEWLLTHEKRGTNKNGSLCI